MVASQIAAVISVAGAALLLAVWHDPDTLRAIAGSGGLGEVFILPFMMIIPAVIVGWTGALVGRACVALVYAPSRAKTKSA